MLSEWLREGPHRERARIGAVTSLGTWTDSCGQPTATKPPAVSVEGQRQLLLRGSALSFFNCMASSLVMTVPMLAHMRCKI